MKYALLSDIHGNLEAFQAVLSCIKGQSPDCCLFLGDAVGYGPDPGQVLDLLAGLKARCIAGNHDWAVLGRTDISSFNSIAREAVLWTRRNTGPRARRQLSAFPLVIREDDFTAVHGSLDDPGEFRYIFSRSEARDTFSLMDTRICFVGHTHCPGVFMERGGRVVYTSQQHLILRKDTSYIINAGSVGQPRDRDSRACFCIYDSGKGIVTFHRLGYNVKKTADKIISAGLPVFLAERLFLGC